MKKALLICFITLQSLSAQQHSKAYDLLPYSASLIYWSPMSKKTSNDFSSKIIEYSSNFAIMAMTVKGLKQLTQVERPNQLDFNSFPSGHTAVAAMGAELLRTQHPKKPELWIPSYLIVGLVGHQRIRDGYHRPIEVISGALIGVASVHLNRWIHKKIKKRSKK